MKKLMVSILAGTMILSFAACGSTSDPEDSLTYDTKNNSTSNLTETSGMAGISPSTKPIWSEPVAPDGWQYPKINLSEGKYTASDMDPAVSARNFGYQTGTYEYEYFRALSGISFYARIASNKVSSAVKNTAVSNLAEGFFEIISRDAFIAPYEDILYHTFSLLKNADFTLFADNEALITEHQNTLSHQWDKPTEIFYTSALSFTDIDTKLSEYARDLLCLKEKYPDYTGEFMLTTESRSFAQAMADSCKVVADNRKEQWTAWEKYFKEATPKVTVTAEVIPEKGVVKMTFTSDHALSVRIDPKYISDFKGEVVQNGNAVSYHYDPMESPVVCYVPIGLFYSGHGEFSVTKYVTDGSVHSYKETVKVSPDFSLCFSNETVKVSDPFLDAVLKAEFGDSYSERDLSEIREITVSYRRTKKESLGGISLKTEPTISICYYNRERGNGNDGFSYHAYSDYFDKDFTEEFPLNVLNDMEYFPLLKKAAFKQDGATEVPLPEGYLDRILIKEYTAEDFT